MNLNGNGRLTNFSYNETLLEKSQMSLDSLSKQYCLLIMLAVPLITMVGNLLVVISVYHERNLRNTTNYFIVSLAIADISLAVTVMPLTIWIEVNNGIWTLGVALCDAFIVADVTFCTASIFNLTAISIDRYVAVTMPLKYSQHRGSIRIIITIAMSWLISFAIALPMAFGLNHRINKTSINICTFNNADFIIWSSLGSFYVPTVVTISLYYKIFKVLHERANCKRQSKPQFWQDDKENDYIIKEENINLDSNGEPKEKFDSICSNSIDLSHRVCPNKEIFENCFTNFGIYRKYNSFNSFTFINNVQNDTLKHSITRETCISMISEKSELNHSLLTLYSDLPNIKNHLQLKHSTTDNSLRYPDNIQMNNNCLFTDMQQFRLHLKNRIKNAKREGCRSKVEIPVFFRFKLDKMRHKRIANKVLKRSTRKEKRATKTLAIVLACFLICWAPYFAVNLMMGICVKFDLNQLKSYLEPTYATVTWFGYINSFLNPIIYTTFNAEFRNAFKKLLTCRY